MIGSSIRIRCFDLAGEVVMVMVLDKGILGR